MDVNTSPYKLEPIEITTNCPKGFSSGIPIPYRKQKIKAETATKVYQNFALSVTGLLGIVIKLLL